MKKYNEMLFPVNGRGEVVEKEPLPESKGDTYNEVNIGEEKTDLSNSLICDEKINLPRSVEGENEKLISSVELCEVINKIRKEEGVNIELLHKSFLIKIRTEFDIIEGKEMGKIFCSSYLDSMNREKICYLLNKKQALQMIVSESKKVRGRLIDELERLYEENKQLKQQLYSYQIEDPIERAKLWIKEQEAHREEIKQKDNKILLLKQQEEENRPLVEYANSVNEVDDTISFNEFAKAHFDTLCIGEKKLFSLCREIGILQSTPSHWNIPYQEYIDRGYFKLIQQVYNQGCKSNTNMKTVITGKGRIWLLNKIKGGLNVE